MHWGGIVKTTTLDFPEHLACVLFCMGCNLRCPWCHNARLIPVGPGVLSESEVLDFLKKRQKVLSGVVVSGGEPTLDATLPHFLRQVKNLGYQVKLDTNGLRPKVLRELITNQLVDYIALDVKGLPEDYPRIAGMKIDPQQLLESIELVRQIPHEYRLTVVPHLHSKLDTARYGLLIGEGPLYLQGFRSGVGVMDGAYANMPDCTPEFLHQLTGDLQQVIKGRVQAR